MIPYVGEVLFLPESELPCLVAGIVSGNGLLTTCVVLYIALECQG